MPERVIAFVDGFNLYHMVKKSFRHKYLYPAFFILCERARA